MRASACVRSPVIETLGGLVGARQHGLDCNDGKHPAQGLRPQDDAIHAVDNHVRDVRGLCARGPRVDHHRVEHPRREDGLAKGIARVHERLHEDGKLFHGDVDSQIPPRDDNAVGFLDDALGETK